VSSKKRERKERISTNDRWGEIGTNKGEWGEGGEIGESGVDCVQWGGRRGFGTRDSRGIDDANRVVKCQCGQNAKCYCVRCIAGEESTRQDFVGRVEPPLISIV
jgi:hypothetical protein